MVTDDNFAWTGPFPTAPTAAVRLDDCHDWTSNSASDLGDGGDTGQTNCGFTAGKARTPVIRRHHVMLPAVPSNGRIIRQAASP